MFSYGNNYLELTFSSHSRHVYLLRQSVTDPTTSYCPHDPERHIWVILILTADKCCSNCVFIQSENTQERPR